jgi:ubiquinone/menaquinone biosynthesis C-methylase UbiE
MSAAKNHYSYRVYADPETARTFDSERFGSAIGEFIKQTQERIVFSTLPDVSGWRVIDIGAGTGRFTIAFLDRGSDVTACDASAEMLNVLQSKIAKGSRSVQTETIDAQELTFPDKSFDCAVSFRLLMHVIDWQKALSEICRVSKDWVVFDFPARRGFLRLTPLFHFLRKPFSNNLQAYKILSLPEVQQILRSNNFNIVSQDDGYFLPIVVHRMMRSPGLSRTVEKAFAGIRLTKLFGSPVTIFARRIG